VAGEAPTLVGEVTLDEDRARKLLGTPDITGDEIHAILEKLGLTKKSANKHESHWLIPSYRLDLQRPVDLIEELARVIGLDRVPSRQVAVASPVEAADRTTTSP
jgi:phenylalanyl-tRNA synthetase beta chain